MTGNLSSLRVLKDTLEKVEIEKCHQVVGNFMDLADFPQLKVLNLNSTSVTGDIRDIGANDFTALTKLTLPRTVYGGNRHEFQSIAEVPVFMAQIYPLAKRFSLNMFWRLSNASPDWYDDPNEVDDERHPNDGQIPPPFVCELITLQGTRIGWRWRCNFPDEDLMNPDYCPSLYSSVVDPFGPLEFSDLNSSCEINWLEPEPDRERNVATIHRLKMSITNCSMIKTMTLVITDTLLIDTGVMRKTDCRSFDPTQIGRNEREKRGKGRGLRIVVFVATCHSWSRSWRLSEASPDWYDDPNEVDDERDRKEYQIPPPFVCELLRGTRIGWRWRCNFPDTRIYFHDMINPYDPDEEDEQNDPLEEVEMTSSCEIYWLEPEPDRESTDYEKYTDQLSD
eukprot:scaffold1903_cov126-Skeletonema_marinoi.AAC.1